MIAYVSTVPSKNRDITKKLLVALAYKVDGLVTKYEESEDERIYELVINENIIVSENLNENELFKLFASVTNYMTDERSLVLQIDKNVH